MAEQFACLICDSPNLDEIREFVSLPRVTSDCRPFPSGGRLVECLDCGGTQKLVTNEWLAEIARIYANYTPYHQAEGIEQIVMDSETGTLRRRSEVVVSRLLSLGVLSAKGSVLDVGCGSGATLKVFSREMPERPLYGYELSEAGHEHLRAIPRFRKLYTNSLTSIDQKFNLVTSIHSLEHFVNPLDMLVQLRQKIESSGWLFIELYNSIENPFDLLIADHLMHFTPQTLVRIVERAGFEAETLKTSWIAKEISLLARPGVAISARSSYASYPEVRGRRMTVQWLGAIIREARRLAAEAPRFGLFGTSIPATWLAGSLGKDVHFFVDEDPSRQNRNYMDRPVVSPGKIPHGSVVYLALAPAVAANVQRRLAALDVTFIAPGSKFGDS